ncbi:MAG TPA: hypothetical protein VFN71_06905 [Methylomirabilota bacterium]|nr:hypothetical protein [Methylomirabilota bacterium]
MRSRRRSGLIRIGIGTALGLALLLTSCASTARSSVRETNEQTWGRCDRAQQPNVAVLCYQR